MIYLLEDDESIRRFVVYALVQTGFEAKGFALPSEFWSALKEEKPELLLLDIMLPEEDGISVLKRLRGNTETADLPIIMLTAKASEYDKVSGLDAGADDYLTKPFGTMELVSRIKALMRRTGVKTKSVYSVGGVTVNADNHTVLAGDMRVTLTLKEFELLNILIANPDRVFTRDILLQKIWGYDYDGENRTVDVHIKTLRTKLGEYGNIIETVRGIGYKIGAE